MGGPHKKQNGLCGPVLKAGKVCLKLG
jgi:hypothetical protein